MSIASRLQNVRDNIEDACSKAGVPSDTVTLVAVSKTVDADAVREAYNCGQRVFGENRVQEWETKRAALPDDIEWTLIGRLQTNKVKYIITPEIPLIQSLDRIDLAREIQRYCEIRNCTADVLIQLNLSREETKAGVYEENVDSFLDEITSCTCLRMRGLMTIGPNTLEERPIRDVFRRAKSIYDRLAPVYPDFRFLSMGMSHDFGLAILEGSNMIRVGTSIFGERR